MTDFDTERNPIEVLADEFTRRCRRGETPAISEYTKKYPELADQINRLFPSIAMMEQLAVREETDRQAEQTRAAFSSGLVEQVGDYRILREAGRGGMGIVYEAVQESLGRRVAVKILARQALLDEKHLRRFRREAKTAAGLHHTNIVPVFGVGEQDGYHYYVMQFIPGVGLDEVLVELAQSDDSNSSASERPAQLASIVRALQDGSFRYERASAASSDTGSSVSEPPVTLVANGVETETARETSRTIAETTVRSRSDLAAASSVDTQNEAWVGRDGLGTLSDEYWRAVGRIGLQVADALHYAHRQGILHRDIKPGNLLLDSSGVVWVADFGLAKALEHDDVSQTGDVVGTLRYMAPEQFAGQADHLSDIYSLGLTLYETLTLRPAFEDASRSHLVPGQGGQSELVRPRKLHPGIPVDLETIVLKASSRDPRERYQSAEDMAVDLQRFLEDRPILARRATVVERLSRWCRRNPAIAGLSGLALLLLLLVAASTSVGYFKTTAALTREREAREQSDATLGISLEALDKIYRRFAPERLVEVSQLMVESDDGEEVQLPSQAVLSEETAVLLQDILGFYDRFASQNSDSMVLRAEAAKANRRVGDIQQRLGAFDQAEIAYRGAIERYQEIMADPAITESYTTQLARVHNELGNVYRAWQQPDQARESFLAALAMLRPTDKTLPTDTEASFELARTLYSLGKRNLPSPVEGPPRPERGRPPGKPHRGPGPPWLSGGPPFGERPFRGPGPRGPSRHEADNGDGEYLNEAIVLLKSLDERTSNPECRYLLALCYRERARGSYSDDAQEAIQLLEELTEQHPTVADYRYELSETYARGDVRRLRDGELTTVEERLRKALGHAQTLTREHPSIPVYAQSLAHTNHKLGTVVRRSTRLVGRRERGERFRESEAHYAEAVRIQTEVVRQFPQVTSYGLWLAKMQESWADILWDTGNPEDASEVLQTSIVGLNHLLSQDPELWFVRRTLAEHNQFLARILVHLGDEEGAQTAAEQAMQYRFPFKRRQNTTPE